MKLAVFSAAKLSCARLDFAPLYRERAGLPD
jgi:hypothetical protein